MSHHSGNYGGQCPSPPPTTGHKIAGWSVLALMAIAVLAVTFGPFIAAVVWWVR
jgi:hypothetical protein